MHICIKFLWDRIFFFHALNPQSIYLDSWTYCLLSYLLYWRELYNLECVFDWSIWTHYSDLHVLTFVSPHFYQIGLVIDLTNTSRYYSPSEWTKQGTKHVKVREWDLSLGSNMYVPALIGFFTMRFFFFHFRLPAGEEMLYQKMNLLILLCMR